MREMLQGWRGMFFLAQGHTRGDSTPSAGARWRLVCQTIRSIENRTSQRGQNLSSVCCPWVFRAQLLIGLDKRPHRNRRVHLGTPFRRLSRHRLWTSSMTSIWRRLSRIRPRATAFGPSFIRPFGTSVNNRVATVASGELLDLADRSSVQRFSLT